MTTRTVHTPAQRIGVLKTRIETGSGFVQVTADRKAGELVLLVNGHPTPKPDGEPSTVTDLVLPVATARGLAALLQVAINYLKEGQR